MKVEVGQRYMFDGQVVTIDYVCEQYANNMSPDLQEYKRYQVTGINQHGHKHHFTFNGINLWLAKANLIYPPKYDYPNRIGKYIHNVFKRIYSRGQ
jgi:hypothetical protein